MAARKLIISTLGVVSLITTFWVEPAVAEITSLSSAINKAGRQRMLTQRIVKAYCQIGLDVRTDEAREQLAAALALFDAQLSELIAFNTEPETRKALELVGLLWQPFKEVAAGPINPMGAKQLMQMNEDLLSATHQVVLLLQDTTGTPHARLVNISGRQRMLSQRVAKFYLLRQWNVANATLTQDLQQAATEFKAALEELKNAPQNTDAIRTALQDAETQWRLFEYSLNNEQQDLALFVALTSEKTLEIMNQVTGMYEVLSYK